ncbi:hypothetical protein POM88_042034 [Heracleum sosnowskyi]|uniref:Uncharacterized protein n=1 Tax=Heracleum sosnowskyi TaxID=360622 RepID=A0AAD8HH21_9APIA|nr:hypothetical protein POM88_042034 [Heracleum sosnowskyi]
MCSHIRKSFGLELFIEPNWNRLLISKISQLGCCCSDYKYIKENTFIFNLKKLSVESVNKQSYSHNTIYQSKVEVLRKQFPDALIVYADYWNAYGTVIENAHNYGFNELYKVCCGSSGGQYNYDYSGQ